VGVHLGDGDVGSFQHGSQRPRRSSGTATAASGGTKIPPVRAAVAHSNEVEKMGQ
jgi:hypothetical protein